MLKTTSREPMGSWQWMQPPLRGEKLVHCIASAPNTMRVATALLPHTSMSLYCHSPLLSGDSSRPYAAAHNTFAVNTHICPKRGTCPVKAVQVVKAV
jgi:hypothetical protein